MLLRVRELLNLSVVTQSGAHLGRLAGFEFEAESQTIVRYEVRRSLFGPPLLVSRGQVIAIDAQQMIVEDALVPVTGNRKLAVQKQDALPETPLQSVESE